MTDLLVAGGTVVTANGSRRADVAIEGGRITAVGEAAGGHADRRLDATGLLVLPGVIDAHTHVRLPSDEEPDRFFIDSVAAAFGGTTTFVAFNNPGTGISPQGSRSLLAGLREFRSRTEGESAVDFALSAVITGQQPGEGLGTSPSDAGDVNGDGVGDLAVGAWQHASAAPSGT